jgi:hypothetical protein
MITLCRFGDDGLLLGQSFDANDGLNPMSSQLAGLSRGHGGDWACQDYVQPMAG